MPQTREHLHLAKLIGVKNIVVYVNKVDLVDDEIKQLVELELRELLEAYGFNANSQMIFGSALSALNAQGDDTLGKKSIQDLMNALDKVPLPQRDVSGTFLMPVEKCVNVPGRGLVLVGTVSRGTLKKGEPLEVVGNGKVVKTVANELQAFNQSIGEITAGQNVGILARGLKSDQVLRGMYAGPPSTLQQTDQFEAEVYMLNKNEGGRNKPVTSNFKSLLFNKTLTVESMLNMPDDKMVMPGEHTKIKVYLRKPFVMFEGDRFTMREGPSTVFTGIVSKLLPKLDFDIKGFNSTLVSKPRTNNKVAAPDAKKKAAPAAKKQ